MPQTGGEPKVKLSAEGSPGAPTLEEAFPRIFLRSSPSIENSSFVFIAASLLRFHVIEAAMVVVDGRRPMVVDGKVAFISGYPILTMLQKTRPEEIYKSLFEPSGRYTVAVRPVKPGQNLRDLLRVFQESKFGFTTVADEEMYAMVGLSDVLGLYKQGVLGTDLTARDVASRKVSVEPKTKIKDALDVMFERRIRRAFIKGTDSFVSDREIVSHVFSPRELEKVKRAPGSILEGPVIDAEPAEATMIEGDTPLREAASSVVQSQGGALACDEGVVSPWDLVMKPFVAGRLNVG